MAPFGGAPAGGGSDPTQGGDAKEIRRLKDYDRETEVHEHAHLKKAGHLARGGPVYNWKRGPDGHQYKDGGHVDLNTSKTGDPHTDLENGKIIRESALAPDEPSAQDYRVAAEADRMIAEAQHEIQCQCDQHRSTISVIA